jgi:hypothetical protein
MGAHSTMSGRGLAAPSGRSTPEERLLVGGVAVQRRAADTRVLGDGGHRRARGETRLRITESAVALHLGVAKGPRTTLQLG